MASCRWTITTARPSTRPPATRCARWNSSPSSDESAIFVLKDFHPFLDDQRGLPEYPVIVRRLRDLTDELKHTNKTLIILSPLLRFPRRAGKRYHRAGLFPADRAKSWKNRWSGCSNRSRRNRQVHLKLDEQTREKVLKAGSGADLHRV